MVTTLDTPEDIRLAARAGQYRGLTTGLAPGFVQANLFVVPGDWASEFEAFCAANPGACPLLAAGRPGDPHLPELGDFDLRTDLPAYWAYLDGQRTSELGEIGSIWRDDLVAFAVGCWFSMEEAIAADDIRQRHIELGIQGALFITSHPAVPAGRLSGPLVVSMRPFAAGDVARVTEITGRFQRTHGGPIHVGDPVALGIAAIDEPDFGEVLVPLAGEVPMFWGCGLTGLVALQRSGVPFFVTHAAGAMLVTDMRNTALQTGG